MTNAKAYYEAWRCESLRKIETIYIRQATQVTLGRRVSRRRSCGSKMGRTKAM